MKFGTSTTWLMRRSDRDARHHIGLLGRQPVLADHVVDHLDQRVARGSVRSSDRFVSGPIFSPSM